MMKNQQIKISNDKVVFKDFEGIIRKKISIPSSDKLFIFWGIREGWELLREENYGLFKKEQFTECIWSTREEKNEEQIIEITNICFANEERGFNQSNNMRIPVHRNEPYTNNQMFAHAKSLEEVVDLDKNLKNERLNGTEESKTVLLSELMPVKSLKDEDIFNKAEYILESPIPEFILDRYPDPKAKIMDREEIRRMMQELTKTVADLEEFTSELDINPLKSKIIALKIQKCVIDKDILEAKYKRDILHQDLEELEESLEELTKKRVQQENHKENLIERQVEIFIEQLTHKLLLLKLNYEKAKTIIE